jgi:hypothetical protein
MFIARKHLFALDYTQVFVLGVSSPSEFLFDWTTDFFASMLIARL